MATDYPTAAFYDKCKGAVEPEGAQRPISKTAMKARKRAMREGRLIARPRDEPEPVAVATKPKVRKVAKKKAAGKKAAKKAPAKKKAKSSRRKR